jgi:hypothetical protein
MTTSPMAGSALEERVFVLDATDRCDACSAQAHVVVVLRSGGELLFCGHHFARHEDSLGERAACIVDSRTP